MANPSKNNPTTSKPSTKQPQQQPQRGNVGKGASDKQYVHGNQTGSNKGTNTGTWE